MNIDIVGKNLIYKEEGVLLNAYLCPAKVWTIGVGFTYYSDGRKVKQGDKITQVECDLMFKEIVKDFENAVTKAIKVEITQNQFNALVSLAFNIGVGAFAGSTLVKKINSKASLAEIEKWFIVWKNAGGKPILLQRRIREFKVFISE